MTEPIKKYQPVRRASIVPASSAAPEAPVMVAPGAPSIESPVSQASREREARVHRQFEDIEARYGRHEDVRHRRAEMEMREGPDTPVTDAYTVQMRPRVPVAGVPLEPLVIAKEQRKREEGISAEAYRAATLPGELQYDIQVAAYHRQMAEYDRQMSEYHKAVQEQRARDAEAQKYGHATHESLMQAIQEEKLIKRLNELGGLLTDVQLEAQRAAREGVPQADYMRTLEIQRAEIERLQRSLQTSFGIETRAGTDYVADVQAVMGARDVEPVTMRTMAVPAEPATMAGYDIRIMPGTVPLRAGDIEMYREPVPSDPVEQIFYHHAPIIDKFRADTKIEHPAVDVAFASVKLSRAARGAPSSPIVVPIAEQLVREPTRSISAVIEMPGELALGVYRIPTVAIPHYKAHPEELPGLPGKIVSGMGKEFVADPVGFTTKLGATAIISGPAIQVVKPVTVPITRYARDISMSLRRTKPPAGVSPAPPTGAVYGDVVAFPDVRKVADVGKASVYGDVVAFPDVRKVADVGKASVYGDTVTFPDVRKVADVGKASVYGDTVAFPDIRKVADIGKASVYGDTVTFPDIRKVADVGKTSVYGDTVTFPDIKKVADVATPPKTRVVYTPEELGKRQRQTMANRATGIAPAPVRKVPTYKVSVPGVTPLGAVESGAPQTLISPLRATRPVISPQPATPVQQVMTAGGGTVPLSVIAGATTARVVTGVRRDIGIATAVRAIPGIASASDTGVTPFSISAPDATPITKPDTLVVPDTAVVNVPAADTVTLPGTDTVTLPGTDTVTLPETGTPIVRPPVIPVPRPPRIRPPREPDEGKRKRYPWDEWFISYRDAPTPHKGFEGVYLGLPDIARPGAVTIRNLQRFTRGPAPARTVRPKVTRGKPVRLRIGTKRLL